MIQTIEIIGSFIAMFGAWYAISSDDEKNPNARKYGFMLFAFSNFFMIFFSFSVGLYFLLLQMMILNVGSLYGVIKYWSRKVYLPVLFASSIMWIYVLSNMAVFDFSTFNMNIIEASASAMAIIGSFTLLAEHKGLKNFTYAMFFFADILYIEVAYTQQHLFFGIMSAFFVFTSIRGFYFENFKQSQSVVTV